MPPMHHSRRHCRVLMGNLQQRPASFNNLFPVGQSIINKIPNHTKLSAASDSSMKEAIDNVVRAFHSDAASKSKSSKESEEATKASLILDCTTSTSCASSSNETVATETSDTTSNSASNMTLKAGTEKVASGSPFFDGPNFHGNLNQNIFTPGLATSNQSLRCFSTSAANVNPASEQPTLNSEGKLKTKIPCEMLYNKLLKLGVEFYAGVPDSLLKDYCAYVTDNCSAEKHIICANEGTAVGTAAGYHLASNSIPLVYMQNSGFGNIINPILSLASTEVYRIPMLLLVGWRGEPGVKDEPQHNVMGRLQESILSSCEIPYCVLPQSPGEELDRVLKHAVEKAQKDKTPFALLVRKNTFEKYELSDECKERIVTNEDEGILGREGALQALIEAGKGSHGGSGFLVGKPVVSTTGVLSRELYELREKLGIELGQDFLCVGSMGHASAIGHGIACAPAPPSAPPVVVLDGDGAALMHLGQMAINGTTASQTKRKLVHILINNGLHESVGGQPTAGLEMNFSDIARACNYSWVRKIKGRLEDIEAACNEIESIVESDLSVGEGGEGTSGQIPSFFLEILVKPGVKEGLGRPKSTPEENKLAFCKTHFGGA